MTSWRHCMHGLCEVPHTPRIEMTSLRSSESPMVETLQEIMKIYHKFADGLRSDSLSGASLHTEKKKYQKNENYRMIS